MACHNISLVNGDTESPKSNLQEFPTGPENQGWRATGAARQLSTEIA